MELNSLHPQARTEDLVVQTLGDECLVYDRKTDLAHCLSEVAARVWKGCDGRRDLAGLAAFTGCSEDSVADALVELGDKSLLDGGPGSPDAVGSSVSRRQALGRMAKVGAGAVAVPLIFTASAGAATFSPGLHGGCNEGHHCNSGLTCYPATGDGTCLIPALGTGCTTASDCVPLIFPLVQTCLVGVCG